MSEAMKMPLVHRQVGIGTVALHQLIQPAACDCALTGSEQRAGVPAAFPQIAAQRFHLAITQDIFPRVPALHSNHKDSLGFKPKMRQLDQPHFRRPQAAAVPNLEDGQVPSTLASCYRQEEGLQLRLCEITDFSLGTFPAEPGWVRLCIWSLSQLLQNQAGDALCECG